jgi:hypothetical protein
MTKGPYMHPDMPAEELEANAREMGRRRWEGVSPKKRSTLMRKAISARVYVPPDPSKPRCACGKMTLTRAEARADVNGKGLGHLPGCTFYRRQRHFRPGHDD